MAKEFLRNLHQYRDQCSMIMAVVLLLATVLMIGALITNNSSNNKPPLDQGTEDIEAALRENKQTWSTQQSLDETAIRLISELDGN